MEFDEEMAYHPIVGDLLQKHLRLLLKNYGHRFQMYFTDAYGTFAAKLKCGKSGLPFILSSTATLPYKNCVSFQLYLLKRWKTIHVLGMQPEERSPLFYVFSGRRIESFPDECWESEYKPGCTMIHFPFNWGEIWNPLESLAPVWEKVKEKTPEHQGSLESFI